MKLSDHLAERLETACRRINTPGFIADDPVQFPRRFASQPDVEIVALLSAIIAWGRRPQILKDCEKLLNIMEQQPYHYLMSGGWKSLDPKLNIHRTCFGSHIQYFLRGLSAIYRRYSTLEEFAAACGAPASETPAWTLLESMQQVMRDENEGAVCPEVIPTNLASTALKRYNMAFRWLVRDDGIVDLGLWKALRPSQLFIPLDVHVGNTSRALGLLERRSNDRKAVELLTASLRKFDASDPVRFDFALFGLGIEGSEL